MEVSSPSRLRPPQELLKGSHPSFVVVILILYFILYLNILLCFGWLLDAGEPVLSQATPFPFVINHHTNLFF